jgi:hypothetical protein
MSFHCLFLGRYPVTGLRAIIFIKELNWEVIESTRICSALKERHCLSWNSLSKLRCSKIREDFLILLLPAVGLLKLGVKYVTYKLIAKRWPCKQRPLLRNGSVNTFPLLGSRFLIMQQLDYNNGRVVFSTWSVPRGFKRPEVWSLVSWEWVIHGSLWREDLSAWSWRICSVRSFRQGTAGEDTAG